MKGQVKICNPSYYLPYAGFFSERAPRDAYIKNLNVKNKTGDYVEALESLKVDVLDPTIDDSFLFHGKKIKERKKIGRYAMILLRIQLHFITKNFLMLRLVMIL